MKSLCFGVLFLCGSLHAATPQQIAETKANYMARRSLTGHHLMHLGFGGGSFEGTGYSSNPNNVPTCNNGGQCLGDATVRGANGMYHRVRIFGPGRSYSNQRSYSRKTVRRRAWRRRR